MVEVNNKRERERGREEKKIERVEEGENSFSESDDARFRHPSKRQKKEEEEGEEKEDEEEKEEKLVSPSDP